MPATGGIPSDGCGAFSLSNRNYNYSDTSNNTAATAAASPSSCTFFGLPLFDGSDCFDEGATVNERDLASAVVAAAHIYFSQKQKQEHQLTAASFGCSSFFSDQETEAKMPLPELAAWLPTHSPADREAIFQALVRARLAFDAGGVGGGRGDDTTIPGPSSNSVKRAGGGPHAFRFPDTTASSSSSDTTSSLRYSSATTAWSHQAAVEEIRDILRSQADAMTSPNNYNNNTDNSFFSGYGGKKPRRGGGGGGGGGGASLKNTSRLFLAKLSALQSGRPPGAPACSLAESKQIFHSLCQNENQMIAFDDVLQKLSTDGLLLRVQGGVRSID
jgi:hypothetical protein